MQTVEPWTQSKREGLWRPVMPTPRAAQGTTRGSRSAAGPVKRVPMEKFGLRRKDLVTVGDCKEKLKNTADPLATVNRGVQKEDGRGVARLRREQNLGIAICPQVGGSDLRVLLYLDGTVGNPDLR